MLISCNNDGFALFLRNSHWHNLCRKAPRLLGGDRLPMTVQRVDILIRTADVIAFCNVLCCFAHAIGMVHGAQFGVDETPAYRRVLQMHGAVECRIAFPQYEWGTGHALYTTCDKGIARARLDRLSCAIDGLQA